MTFEPTGIGDEDDETTEQTVGRLPTIGELFKRYMAARKAAGLGHRDPDTPETEKSRQAVEAGTDAPREGAASAPDPEARLAEITNRNRRLLGTSFTTHGMGHGCPACDLVRGVDDVQWLLAEREGQAKLDGYVAVWHDTALVQHEVDEIRCQACRAYMAGPLPLPSPVTLADLVALASRHECLPRMDAAQQQPEDGDRG